MITDDERRAIVHGLNTGDLLKCFYPIDRQYAYFAVLERVGVKVVLSVAVRSPENLVPVKNIAGVMEITEDGKIDLADGTHSELWSDIVAVKPHGALHIAESFARRIRPRQAIIARGVRIEASEQIVETTKRIRELVLNEDNGGKYIALLEAFFRIIGRDVSSEESTFYLHILFMAMAELEESKAEMAIRKEISLLFEKKEDLDLDVAQRIIDDIARKK